MNYIYIGFSYPKDFKIGAKAISIWMNKPYSHTYIRFDSSEIQSTVYHAAHGMVHFMSYDRFTSTNNVVKEYKIELDDVKRSKILKYCIDIAGNPYGYLELLTILCSDIAHNLGVILPTQDGRGYICSELVGKLCIEEFNMTFDKPTHLLTPADIDNAFENR